MIRLFLRVKSTSNRLLFIDAISDHLDVGHASDSDWVMIVCVTVGAVGMMH